MDKLIEMIKHHEGVVPHAYADSRGYWTIGVGRLIDQELGGGLSEDEIDYLLANDLKRCREEAETYPWFAGLSEPRQAVVISMLFNLGKPRGTASSSLRRRLRRETTARLRRRCSTASGAQVGKRAEDMAAMMISGEWMDG